MIERSASGEAVVVDTSDHARRGLQPLDWLLLAAVAVLLLVGLVLTSNGSNEAGLLILLALLLNFVLLYRNWRRRVQDGTWPKRRYGDGPPWSDQPQ